MENLKEVVSKTKKDLFDSRENSTLYYFALAFLTLLFFIFMLSEGTGIVGVLGRTLGFLILVILAYSMIDWVSSSTKDPEYWEDKRELDEEVNLRIQEASELLERVSKGGKISKKNLSKKIREVFYIKLKEKKDLSNEEVRELLKDEERFREVVKDSVISDFILSSNEDKETTNGKKGSIEKLIGSNSSNERGEEHKKEIERVIRRISTWD
ncbi:MAG: hypothetical protein ACOC55_02740 [Candidatus Natronoplasma sp.]